MDFTDGSKEEIVRIEPCPVHCGSTGGCDRCVVPAVLKVGTGDSTGLADKFG